MNEGIAKIEKIEDLNRVVKIIKILKILIAEDTREIDREIHRAALKSLEEQKKALLNK